MKAKKTLITLVCLTLVSGTAIAGKNKGQGMKGNMQRPAFTDFDTNGDQLISEEEFNTFRETRQQARSEEGRLMRGSGQISAFSSFDKDSDGFISEEEFLAKQGTGRAGKGRKNQ